MKLNDFLKKADLIKILEKLNLKNIKPLVDDVMVSCYRHEDYKPSLGINKYTGIYNCFSCGDKGNLITLVAKQRNISNSEAIKLLYKFAGIRLTTERLVVNSKMVYRQIKKLLKPKQIKVKKKRIIEPIVRLPLNTTHHLIAGIEYFKARGINEAALRNHAITFCTSGFYKNRAIIPIQDENGRLVSFEARDITGMAEQKVLYPKGSNVNNTLYNLYKTREKKNIIIVEGMMDAIYLTQRGFDVVSTYNATVSERQEELLSRYFRRVYFAYDGDKAGRAGAIKYGPLLDLHLSVYIITLPAGKDPDELTKQEFTELYRKAEHIDTYLAKRLINKII